jgi:chromosome partitioning protein
MITLDILRKFIATKPALNLSQIEKEAGMPQRTLHRCISESKPIPSKYVADLEVVLRQYGYAESLFAKAQVFSLVNHQGGVGKTTTTINLGKALSLMGNKVLLVDMDSQGNLSQCFGVHQPKKQVINALLDDEPLPIIEVSKNLFLAPSDITLADRESEFSTVVGAERRLSLAIYPIEKDFDYILIDCPPSLSICTISSLVASNFCLIPIQPEASAFHGVDNLFKRIKQVQTYSNSSLRVKGIVFTMVLNQNVHKALMEQIKEKYGHFSVCKTIIENSKYVRESQVMQNDLHTYNPKSLPWEQYNNLASEILIG